MRPQKTPLPVPDFTSDDAGSTSFEGEALVICDRGFFEARAPEYKEMCRRLNLDEDTSSRAWDMLLSIPTQQTKNPDRLFKCLTVCSVYSAGKMGSISTVEGGNRQGTGVPLTQLLHLADVRLFAFIKLMKAFNAHVEVNLTHQLELLERKFVVISVLYQKYEDMFEKVIAKRGIADMDLVFYLGWLLFLVAKGHLLSDPPELVKAYHLLLCCLHTLHISFPHSTALATASSASSPLEALATFGLANYEDTKALFEGRFSPFLEKLIEDGLFVKATDISAEREQEVLLGNRSKLEAEYALLYHITSDFDERLFLTAPDDIGTPSCRVAQTPMRTALEAADWLARSTSVLLTPTMGSELRRHCDECDSSLAEKITRRVDAMAAVLPFAESIEERQVVCTKLYYRVLECLVLVEETRTGKSQFATLLNNEAFHKSLFACCAVITAHSLRAHDLQFPKPLELLGVTQFSFLKVIENLVRHCTMGGMQLHPSVLGHLKRIEVGILECGGWNENGVVVELLRNPAFRQSLVSYIQQWSARDPGESGNRAALLASPGVSRLRGAPSALYSPAPKLLRPQSAALLPVTATSATAVTPSPGRPSARSHSLQLFYRKLLQLAEQRLSDLCSNMKVSSRMFGLVWRVLIEVLVEHWGMMVGRQLDQIIMCTLFGVCKVNGLDISFNTIAAQYKRLPHAQDRTLRAVRGTTAEDTMDIIRFYNEVFVVTLDATLRTFATSAPSEGPGVAPGGLLTPHKYLALTPLHPLRLSVSPASKKRSPAVLSSHSVGQSPRANLQVINDALKASPSKPGPQKRLRFDSADVATVSTEGPSRHIEEEEEEEEEEVMESESTMDASEGTT